VSLLSHLDEAVRLIESRTKARPRVGLVLGSGLGAFAKTLDEAIAIPYGEIPHFPVSSTIKPVTVRPPSKRTISIW
jgi:purine-nucleoside phosphorylase